MKDINYHNCGSNRLIIEKLKIYLELKIEQIKTDLLIMPKELIEIHRGELRAYKSIFDGIKCEEEDMEFND